MKLVDLSGKKHLLLKGLSYFENGTQLWVFRNEILAHLSKYHIILHIRRRSRKVAGGEWCVHVVDNLPEQKLFFPDQALAYP